MQVPNDLVMKLMEAQQVNNLFQNIMNNYIIFVCIDKRKCMSLRIIDFNLDSKATRKYG